MKGELAKTEVLNKNKKEKDGGFKVAPDGRLIIKDTDKESDDEEQSKRFNVPGLSDSGKLIIYYSCCSQFLLAKL